MEEELLACAVSETQREGDRLVRDELAPTELDIDIKLAPRLPLEEEKQNDEAEEATGSNH